MTVVGSRLELKEFSLRKLGAPVIKINVSDAQLEDRIDDALQYFHEWHMEGTEKLYMKHQPTATVLKFAAAIPAGSFIKGDTVTGGTSQASSVVWDQAADNLSIRVWQTVGPAGADGMFVAGESLVGPRYTATIGPANPLSPPVVPGDLDNKWVPIPDPVISVVRIFPVNATLSSNFLFDPIYYSAFDLIWNFNGLDLVSYDVMKTRINFINEMLVGQKPVRFNRYMNKLYIDFDWKRSVNPSSWIMIECWRVVNPETFPDVYNDFFLKEYVTALFKIQWGNNLSKFQGIQMVGGVTLDGQRILQEGTEAKKDLEEQMKAGRWSAPLGFIMG